LSRDQFPAYFAALEENIAIVAHNAHTDARTREFSDSYLAPLGITSMLDAPIMTGGRIAGVLCCEHIGPARRWTFDEQNFVASLANTAGLALEISERSRAQKALVENEKLLGTVVNTTQEAMISINQEGLITLFNQAAQTMFGRDESEMLGQPLDILMPEEYRPRHREYIKSFFAKGKPDGAIGKVVELPALHSDGTEFLMEISLATATEGGRRFVIAIARDITARKRAETKLIESEERYRDIVERANDGIVVLQNSHIAFVNARLAELLGYSTDELIDTLFIDYIHVSYREEAVRRHEQRLAGENAPQIYHIGLLHRDGHKIVVEANAGVIQFNGAAANFVFVRELAARQQLENEEMRRREIMKIILDALEDGIYITSHDYTLLYANQSLVGQFGSYQGQKCHQYLAGLDSVCPWCRKNHVAPGKMAHWQWQSSTTDKTYDVVFTQLDGFDNDTAYLGALREVADQELMQRTTDQAQEILAQIFNESLDILMIIDEQGKVLRVSRAINDALGYEAEEFVGTPISRLFKPRSEPAQDDVVNQLRVYGGVFDGLDILRADGSVCLMDITATIIPWVNTRAILATLREVTERKSIEARLRENEEQYRTIIENTFDLIISYTRDGQILYASPQISRYGYTPSDVIGRNLMEFVHDDDRKRVLANLRHAVKDGSEFVSECRLVGGDGKVYYIEEIGKIVRQDDEVVQITGVIRDITGRKYAEQVINTRDELIKNTIESLAHPFYVINTEDYAIELANSAAGFHISSDRSTCHSLVYGRSTPCTGPDCPCPLEIVKNTKKAAQVEHVYTDADGNRRVSEIRGYPILDAGGNVKQMIEYSLDITDRKLATEGLRQSEEKYRTLYSSMYEGVALHELIFNAQQTAIDYRIMDVNPAYEQILGLEHRNVIGRLASEVYQADRPPFLEIFRQVVESGDPVTFEEHLTSMEKTFRISAFATGPTKFATIFEDITQHKQYEDQVRILGRLPDENPNPVLRINADGTLMFANKQSGQVLREWQIAVDELIPEQWRRVIADALQAGEQKEIEFKCGDATYLMFVRPVIEANYVNMYLMDLTEHRRTELALRESELQLRQAQKMEAIGRVAGGVAHDFNNLISVIAGHAELLTLRLEADSPFAHNAHEIKETAEQAASLTRQLLAFSRKQVLEPRNINLNVVIAGIEKMLRRLIGDNESISLNTTVGTELGTVKADPGQIEQVLMNLVVNARDAMPRGGNITIETKNIELQDESARDLGLPPGFYVCLRVADTGVGMDEQTKARIIGPFYTTKEAGKGTGLGLATVYGIITQSDGFLKVESEPAKGTTFVFYLPRIDIPSASETDTPDDGERVSGGREFIMVVEDEKEARDMVCSILRGQGHGVVSARDADDALDKCESAPGTIRLLLTDIVMPKMNGVELAEKMVEQRPDLKVIFMSGYNKSAAVKNSPIGKNSPYLAKPFAPDHLRQTISDLLDTSKTGSQIRSRLT